MIRLAIVVSHPIQYHAPLYRVLADSDVLDLEVLFLSSHGVGETYDAGFGRSIEYDVPLLDGFQHRFLPNRSPRPDVSSPFGLINPALFRVLSRERFDVMLVHGYAHLSNWMAFATAGMRHIPFLLRGESRLDIESPRRPALGFARNQMVSWLVRHASGCLAIGTRNRDFYVAHGVPDHRIFFAPYSVDNDRFATAGLRGRTMREERLSNLGLDPSLPLVLFAAKLQPWKRPADVIDATDRMESPVNVVFIGEGPMKPDIDDAIRTRPYVRSLGFVNQQEIGEWYGAADLFVLPSEEEPWGLAVNEAMAAGAVPIVSRAVGCAPDLATQDTGRVVPTGEAGAMASAMDELLSSPASLSRMRLAGQERVARFGIGATALGIEQASIAAVGRPSRE